MILKMINFYYYSVIKLIFIIFGAAPAKIEVRYFVNLKALRQTIETAPDTTFKARKPTRFVTLNLFFIFQNTITLFTVKVCLLQYLKNMLYKRSCDRLLLPLGPFLAVLALLAYLLFQIFFFLLMTNYQNLILDGEVYINVDVFFSMHSAFD
jgi:hypothetical protein